jgi:hypothetical protein
MTTQVDRLVAYLRTHPGASGMELIAALALPKYTSRISDARAAGVNIECFRRGDGRKGYRIVEARPAPLAGTQVPVW